MPEKEPVERGAFRTGGRKKKGDDTDLGSARAPGINPDPLDDPRTGALVLSLIGRLSSLEAEVRAGRALTLGANTRVQTLVIDNEEAQTLIFQLQQEILDLKIGSANNFDDAMDRLQQTVGPILQREPPQMGQSTDRVGVIVQVWASQLRDAINNFLDHPLEV